MYNETIRDLLGVRDPREGLPKLDIKAVAADVGHLVHRHAAFGRCPCLTCPLLLWLVSSMSQEYDVPGLTLVDVTCMDEVLQHMNTGKQNR